ncbi:response regulator [Rhodocaloribacter litoris]|nr:response regulator [Rhodocaloribacter litoris]
MLRSLRRVLRKEPYRVLTATSGTGALAILERHPVQVVLADQRMPDMTGTDLLREVRSRYPATIRIILSGYAEPHAIVAAINEAEVFRFLPKPWNDDDLRATLRAGFARWESRQATLRLTELFRTELERMRRDREALAERLAAHDQAPCRPTHKPDPAP